MASPIDVQVATATANDGFADNHVNFYTTFMRVGVFDSLVENGFYRFTGISGLSGATITAAYISIYPAVASAGALTKISADDQASPAAPTTAADLEGRTKTTAQVDWDGTLTTNQWSNSPDISAIIQELVDSYGDISVIQILHFDDGSPAVYNYYGPKDYSQDQTLCAKLHIEYTAGWTGTIDGVVNPASVNGVLAANIATIDGV